MGKVGAWRASSKACFAGGNVLMCLKYLYNNIPIFRFGGTSLKGHSISSFNSI